MKNYWLDKMSVRHGEDRQSQHPVSGGKTPGRKRHPAVTYKIKLSQDGRTVLHPFPAGVVLSGSKVAITLKDDGEFPLSTYRWLSETHGWGKTCSGTVEATLCTYHDGRREAFERLVLTMTGAEFKSGRDGVSTKLTFALVAREDATL